MSGANEIGWNATSGERDWLQRRAMAPARRCEANARKGTGSGVCDTPLDKHGNCPNVGNHVEE